MLSRASRTSPQAMVVLLRATAANSFKTCTLTLPPSAISSSAWWERGSSCTMAYTKTFVSRNALSLIRLLAVEDESRRKRTPQLAQRIQRALSAWIAADFEGAGARNSNLDAVAFLQ